MFLVANQVLFYPICFPRVRGDVPASAVKLVASPTVFPACAGMFLPKEWASRPVAGFPRVRGDVPAVGYRWKTKPTFSPRARGCSGKIDFETFEKAVFPACAGMFLSADKKIAQLQGFPRVRGDVPAWLMLF